MEASAAQGTWRIHGRDSFSCAPHAAQQAPEDIRSGDHPLNPRVTRAIITVSSWPAVLRAQRWQGCQRGVVEKGRGVFPSVW